MLKLGRITKVKMLFLVLVFVLILAYSNVFEFSAAILEKGLFPHFLSAPPLPKCSTTEQSTVEASLFVLW